MMQDIIGLTLPELRRALCEAQSSLEALERSEKTHRAWAEDRIISAAGGEGKLGSNEAARQRMLLVGLDGDVAWRQFRDVLFVATDLVSHLQTELEIRMDQRIDAQIATRTCLAAALEQTAEALGAEIETLGAAE